MRWIDRAAAAASSCRSADGRIRAGATRILTGHLGIPPEVAEPASRIAAAVETVGRVVDGGAVSPAGSLLSALSRALPPPLGAQLRPQLHWYACRGACFHSDAHFADVLFGAWCVAGPAREIVFPRLDLRVAAAPGDWVVFDPFEPHGVLDPGASGYASERYRRAAANVFVGFEILLAAPVRAAFGVLDAPPPGAVELSSRIPVNAETGLLG